CSPGSSGWLPRQSCRSSIAPPIGETRASGAPGDGKLRALPPKIGLRSSTTTENPRSANSWAAVKPAMPPPTITTRFPIRARSEVGADVVVGDVEVVVDGGARHPHLPQADELVTVHPLVALVSSEVPRGNLHRHERREDAPRELRVP